MLHFLISMFLTTQLSFSGPAKGGFRPHKYVPHSTRLGYTVRNASGSLGEREIAVGTRARRVSSPKLLGTRKKKFSISFIK